MAAGKSPNVESALHKLPAQRVGYLVPRAGLEPARPCGQRILSSRFAQIHANRGNQAQFNPLILLVCVCPALRGFEYTVGQIWDKRVDYVLSVAV